MRSCSVNQFQIGIICALPKELVAVKAVLDEEYKPLESKDVRDHNSYVLGRVGEHNVVAAGLPAGAYGTTSAASVGRDMLRTFHQLRFGLLVGIGGGVPNLEAKHDIRLGDVVVSQPDATHGGVVQYDLGKLLSNDQFVQKGVSNKPPQTLLTALTNLQANLQYDWMAGYTLEINQRCPELKGKGYCYPGLNQDHLHCTSCDPSQWWWILWVVIVWLWPLWRCHKCDYGKMIRPQRPHTMSVIHYGTIASGNTLLKNATKRDQLGKDLGALCVEMEAAGLDDWPCLVVRGICDYSDAYKTDTWQEYAALAAAAFAKELLRYVSPQAATEEQPVQKVLEKFDQHFQRQDEHNTRVEDHNERQEARYYDSRTRSCHRIFGTSDYERQKNINIDAVPGTCRWVLDDPRYQHWFESKKNDLLWISADPGCGKSVLSKLLVDSWFASGVPGETPDTSGRPYAICYFFFKDNEEQSSLSTALCAILHQLFSYQPGLIQHALPAFDKHKEENLIKNINELWRIIQLASEDSSAQNTICVLDALDECCDEDRQLLINLLCQFHVDSERKSKPTGWLKWLVTSRPHDDIQGYFSRLRFNLPSIRLRGEEKNDQVRDEIDLVIGQRMQELGHQLRLTDAKREEVTMQFRKMNNRTYLWLHLVFETIEVMFRRSARPNNVTVPSLPATVDEAYENILQRIVDTEEKRYAKVVLTIIIGARRPLTVAEMALAFDVATLDGAPRSRADLTVDTSTFGDKVRRWCSLFVFVNHNRFYLIHQTAKEFLQGHDNESIPNSTNWKHCLRPIDVDLQMARICVLFLGLSEFNVASQRNQHNQDTDDWSHTLHDMHYTNEHGKASETDTFFAFASLYWAEYVRTIEVELDDQTQSDIRALYDSRTERFQQWTTALWQASQFGHPRILVMNGVHLASHNGHRLALQHLLNDNPVMVNDVTSDGQSLLSWAAYRGQTKIAELLLSYPNIDVNLGKPLRLPARSGNRAMIQLILAHPNIDVNAGEPLYEAAQGGHKEIVELLLAQPDIHVNLGKPLYWAARSGAKDIVELLIARHDIDVNLGRPLGHLITDSENEIVQMLLIHPAIDVNLGEPLSKAAHRGYDILVELLLAVPNVDVNRGKPLYWAARNGNTRVVEHLLRRARSSIDVNLGEPLYAAALEGYVDVVELLLREGQPDIDVNHGWPLYIAARNGHENVVKLLLVQPKIDVNLGKPLYWAARNGH